MTLRILGIHRYRTSSEARPPVRIACLSRERPSFAGQPHTPTSCPRHCSHHVKLLHYSCTALSTMADPLSIIGSVIAILTAAEATYKGIKDIKRLPQAFQKLDTWLPLVRETLKEAEEHCHPADARGLEIEALKEAVETCKQQAEMLQDILKKLEPEDPASVRDKYWKILAAVGKKARVEELMRGILESVHAIACHRMMKAATTAHVGRLEAAIEELKSMQPSDDEVHDAKVVQSINNGQIDKAYNTLTWGNDNKTHTGSGHIFGTVTTLTLNSSSPKSG
ncbi:hypothetical protein CTA2_4239 [Colletotrichum tanaceti]|uniref:NACHT-NTPase and P-loop NTPases N-terminal domain-containing protein n=1 Tax=Colletotrichum tanaceti TaxID=1306861 RepID=A0A4U6XKI3_9PEZI|nr:hypothetical protein CTA2_4239 [Colletotrichum tanaceti]TKW55337.1 hypothetical protein CTA1_12761 [Colletotrichum tanaceti]